MCELACIHFYLTFTLVKQDILARKVWINLRVDVNPLCSALFTLGAESVAGFTRLAPVISSHRRKQCIGNIHDDEEKMKTWDKTR